MVQYIIGGVLIALAIVLTVLILMQTGKDKSLSGAITGGSADTYFGKSGGSQKNKILFRLTVVGSIVFVVLSVALSIILA